MAGLPIWLWGMLGGLILGPIGLVILWPGCSKGPKSLLIRFTISMLTKLIIAGIGLWLAIKYIKIKPEPLVYGFFVGYLISLFLEIIPCVWKLRRCNTKVSEKPSSTSF